MFSLLNLTDAYSPPSGLNRKAISCALENICLSKKRLSPFANTPKEKKDFQRKILKLSIQKMKCISNVKLCLRKSVLINNTVKRLHAELKQEKKTVACIKRPVYSATGVARESEFDVLNNKCLSETF